MINKQCLKDTALAKYQAQDKYIVIFTNYFVDMFREYDELIAQGYKRAPDSFLIASNMNLSVHQTIHMEKPAKLQAKELKAIYAEIDDSNK